MDEILVTFQRAFEYRDLKRENLHLRNQLKKNTGSKTSSATAKKWRRFSK